MTPSSLPSDYLNKIYAGVLGKLIGVYLGRPFENWTYHDITAKLGPIHHYVHEQFGTPLVVIDDDVSGTFAFVRALEEHGAKADLSSEEIGKTWLNQVIEKRTIFWWGGHGISTEHTTFNNLKKGIKPPDTGSIATNGKTLAEQIGAQIFIDGWAMVAPGNPSLAAKLAGAAARVSHDGVAVDAAILWAAMEAEAFVAKDPKHLLDTGLSYIPPDSVLRRLIADVRAWVEQDKSWETTRQRIEDEYGYDKYGGICHMVPNHGIMIMALLYASHDFSLAMHIINTSGWDTDCNSGNIGCLVAIINGLPGFEDESRLDWRGPLADRALISSADGGYSVNDAVRITYDLANIAHRLVGEAPLEPPKDGAQWHFSLPGSVQGFETPSLPEHVSIRQDGNNGRSALGIHLKGISSTSGGVEVLTQTFTPLDALTVKRDYEMMACPLVYPGQTLSAHISLDPSTEGTVSICLRLNAYGSNNDTVTIDSPAEALEPGKHKTLEWTVPKELENKPIAKVGLHLANKSVNALDGTVWLHSLKVSGTPSMTLKQPKSSNPGLTFQRMWNMWLHSWVNSVHKVHTKLGPSFYLAQDHGEGLFYTGTREWKDYFASAIDFTIHLGQLQGIAVRVRGLNRYYAAVLSRESGGSYLSIVKARDEERIVLERVSLGWEIDAKYTIVVTIKGGEIVATVGDVKVSTTDDEYPSGAAGFLVGEGCVSAESFSIAPTS